jgi:hypothetical protein
MDEANVTRHETREMPEDPAQLAPSALPVLAIEDRYDRVIVDHEGWLYVRKLAFWFGA